MFSQTMEKISQFLESSNLISLEADPAGNLITPSIALSRILEIITMNCRSGKWQLIQWHRVEIIPNPRFLHNSCLRCQYRIHCNISCNIFI